MKIPKELRDELTGIDVAYDLRTKSVLVAFEFGNFHITDSVYCPGVVVGNSDPSECLQRIIKAFENRPEQYRKAQ